VNRSTVCFKVCLAGMEPTVSAWLGCCPQNPLSEVVNAVAHTAVTADGSVWLLKHKHSARGLGMLCVTSH